MRRPFHLFSAALLAAALALPRVQRIVVRAADTSELPEGHPLRAKREAVADGAAFVCVGERCSLPVTEPDQIAPTLAAMQA